MQQERFEQVWETHSGAIMRYCAFSTGCHQEGAIMQDGALTLTYGDTHPAGGIPLHGPKVGVSVSSYGTTDPEGARHQWQLAAGFYESRESEGELNGFEYRMSSTVDWALILLVIDERPVIIMAPTEAEALTALSELEPL